MVCWNSYSQQNPLTVVKPVQRLLQQHWSAESNNGGIFRSVRCSNNFQSIARFISILRHANRSRQLAPVQFDPLKGVRLLIWAVVFVRRSEPLISWSRAILMFGFRRSNLLPRSLLERSQLWMLVGSTSYRYFYLVERSRLPILNRMREANNIPHNRTCQRAANAVFARLGFIK